MYRKNERLQNVKRVGLMAIVLCIAIIILLHITSELVYAEEVSGENAELVFESEQDVENDLKAGTVLNHEDTVSDVVYDEKISEETAKQALNNVSYVVTDSIEDTGVDVDIAAGIDDENRDVEDTKLTDNIDASIENAPETDAINVGTEDTLEVDDTSKDTENGEDIEADAENKDLNQEASNQEVSSQEESNQEAEDQEVANQEEAHVNGWIKSGGQWYYYKDNTLVTGWLLDKDKWYYLNPKTGVMQTEWLKYKDNWYYLRPESGAMVANGWAYWHDKWYWLKSSGVMAEGEWLRYKDNWYYLRPESGAMVSNGWAYWHDKWYWLKSSGVMAEGEWLRYKDSWYYLRSESGAMVSNGWAYWNNKWYWLKQSGIMATSEWAKYKNEWYYLNASGVMATGEWTKWKDKWYWLKPSGIMAKGVTECENGNYYYLDNPNGALRTQEGFFDYAGNRYYSKNGGVLYRDTIFTVNGKTYGATSNASLADEGWVEIGALQYKFEDYIMGTASKLSKDILDKIGNDLYKAYQYSQVPYERWYNIDTWTTSEYWAEYGFKNRKGNCYVMAAQFYYLAKTLMYDVRHVSGTTYGGPHSWVELTDSEGIFIYDPDYDATRSSGTGYRGTYEKNDAFGGGEYHIDHYLN